jgi:sporulation protein YlmC with PRC-barrel domain
MASICVALAGVLPALAQERIREERTTTSGGEVRKVSVLMGSNVAIRDGDSLGEVVDLVINDNGCIDFLIVRYEDDYMVVPWTVTTFNVQRRSVVVNSGITRAQLRDVTFTKNRWPNFYSGAFSRNLRTVWGERALRRDHQGGPGDGRRDVRPEDRRDVRPGDRRDVRPEDRREERRDDRRPDNRRPREPEPGRTPPPPQKKQPSNPTPPPPPAS